MCYNVLAATTNSSFLFLSMSLHLHQVVSLPFHKLPAINLAVLE